MNPLPIVVPKLGRNEPCWCGSGRKYKRCHWHRENQRPVPRWKHADAFKSAHSRRLCLVPKNFPQACSGKNIGAHSVSRSKNLQAIAEGGHVYGWPFPGLNELAKSNGFLQPKLIGLKAASTFGGFCAGHDNAIFAPIEKVIEITFSVEQCFLLGYRALAYEMYMKAAAGESLSINRDLDIGLAIAQQVGLQADVNLFEYGNQLGQHDQQEDKTLYDAVLISGDYSSVRAYIVKFETPPTIMSAGRVAPLYDFSGELLQDGCDPYTKLKHLSLNSIATKDGGAVVLTWLADSDDVCIPFVGSLHKTQTCPADAFTRLIFDNLQNAYWSPRWWDALDDASKLALIKRFETATDPTKEDDLHSLKEDEYSYNNWGNFEIQTVGFEFQ